MPKNFLLLMLLIFSIKAQSQVCTNLGQNPSTAFPVCGSSEFAQTTVAICGDRSIPTACTASGALFQDKNPYWYKFTCFAAGTLGFTITPKNLNDDYDWQLFDITDRQPADVYTDNSLFVACNWSGEGGKTGASSNGSSLTVCDGRGKPLYSSMPMLQKGHNYLLLVSHFTDSQSGYSLNFSGGSASITDTTLPRLSTAEASCDGKRVTIKLNKRMKCNSVAANGSDFIITGGGVVNNATGLNCSAGFDMDSLMLTVSNPLPPGTYTATIKNGSDGNTLLDNCNAAIVDGDQVLFTIFPSTPTAFDSIAAVGCAPATLDVILNKPVLCSSVAADGSDFVITGTSPVTITSASVSCNNNLTASIKLTLSAPIKTEGNYEVTLKKGNDGNTIINECSLETEADATVAFATKDTVSANFSFNIKYGCKADTVAFSNSGANGINSWNWRFGNNGISTEPNPVYVYPSFGVKEVRLLVTNGTCADSVANSFNLDNELKANFTAPELLCPADLAKFSETSIGKIVSWNWDFGNGSTSVNKTPPAQVYPAATADKVYPARLIVKNDHNCFDTAYAQVKVLYSCYIAVASAFTPNGDGLNEYLYPTNAWKAKNMVFQVYNRFGQLMFETKDFTQKWDGTFKGIKQQTGTYVWTLQYVHSDTGKPYFLKGTTLLIR